MTIEEQPRSGKTKILEEHTPGILLVRSKDDITAGDGARHDFMKGKAELATRTTCNVFELLRRFHLPLAYISRHDDDSFLTKECEMIPVEVVVRGIATGSYIKRNPEVKDGIRFSHPVVEFFYKTTGKVIKGKEIPCDDPLMRKREYGWELYHPATGESIGVLDSSLVDAFAQYLPEATAVALEVFTVLEQAWGRLHGMLCDFKLEFGIDPEGQLVVADVIDCDSWRVLREGMQLSKQPFRDGAAVSDMLAIYEEVAKLTDTWADRCS